MKPKLGLGFANAAFRPVKPENSNFKILGTNGHILKKQRLLSIYLHYAFAFVQKTLLVSSSSLCNKGISGLITLCSENEERRKVFLFQSLAMDFHSLSRKELQSLCKKNKIPANMTNIAMADALTSLINVEGIEEIGREIYVSEKPQPVPDSPYTCGRQSSRRRAAKDPVVPIENDQESNLLLSRSRCRTRRIIQDEEPEVQDPKGLSENPSVPESPHTGLRASNRRRPVKNPDVSIENNPESSKPPTRNRCRTRRIDQEEEQENEDPNSLTENPSGDAIPKSPATRNGRRRTTGASIVKANEKDEKEKQDLIVTRRSARLQSKVPDANPKPGRRNEAVQIAALSEEETEDLSKKSASRGDEIGVPGDDAKAQDRFSTEKGLRDTEVRALQEGSTPNDASAAAISDKVSSSIAFNVPEQSKREEGEKSILEISIADQDLVSEDASAKEVSGITGLAPDQISQEKTRSSETEESNASTIQGDLVSEDASAPVISAEGLQSQQETVTNMETATESSENVESKNVADLGFQAIADDELCEQVYSELPSLGTLDEEMLGEIESGNGISDQELNNGSVETDQVVECTRDFKDNGIDNLGLQVVIKEDLYADGSGEIPSSLSEVWDFGMMKDSIQECLVPLDSEVLGEMEYGDEKSGKKSLKEPSQLDFYSTENEGLLHCKTHVAQSIGDPLDEKTVVSENKGLVLEQDADVELSVLPDGKKLGSGKFGQIVDGYDADPVATESSPLICDVGLLDEIPFSAAVPILSQVPNYLSPSRGLVSESRYQLNQNNVTPSRSSTKKKATPSQRSAIIMVLDENQGSGGTGLRKKSNSKVLKPAAEEKENRENYSGGLSLKSKSNSKVITSLVEEKDNKKSYSGGLSLRNKSYSKVITSVAEEMKNNNKNFEDSIQRALKNKSLRQLKKMFKEKLSVADNTGDSTNDVIKG